MRIRTIKPEFWRSETVARLSLRTRLTFIGLWNYADDEGRGLDNARLIASDIWPLDDSITPGDVDDDLAAIEAEGLIVRYEVEGRRYFQIRSWREHQTIAKPRTSRLPDVSGTTPGELSEEGRLELGKGTGKGTGNREQETLAFTEFWNVYPRRVAKKAAKDSFHRACQSAAPDVIVEGARRYAADPNREAKYTAHPTTWLNQGRWDDDPIPAPAGAGKARTVNNILALAERSEA